MKKLSVALMTSVLIPVTLSAQLKTTAVPFLRIAPSATINSMGRSGVALIMNDPFLSVDNPAWIPTETSDINFSAGWQHTVWMPNLDRNDLSTNFVSAGYNFESQTGLPFKTQFTWVKKYFDLGENVQTDQTGNELYRFNSWEEANTFSLSVGYTWFAEFSAGASFTRINSHLNPHKNADGRRGISDGNAYSFGLLARAPLHNLLPGQGNWGWGKLNWFGSIGASLINTGERLVYVDPIQKDPLPKTFNIGYGSLAEVLFDFDGKTYTLIGLNGSVNIGELMVDRWGNYTSSPSHISLTKHLIGLQRDPDVIVQRGWAVSLLNTFTAMNGYENQEGYYRQIRTAGYEVTTQGVFRFISGLVENQLAEQILSSAELLYSESEINMPDSGHPLDGTKYSGFRLRLACSF
ncbi:MAG: hypothetical protein L6Q77_01085 [Bacteroidetes bacterium]|nr:hypothetical protein [Bacteroidota bacterium]